MGLGWNVTFENKTTGKIRIGETSHSCWYPNELKDPFDLLPNQKTTKYTEIVSSGTCPLEKSKLILLLTLWGKEQILEIELKGTNGDLERGFEQLVSGNGFEIGRKGSSDLLNFQATKSDQVNVNFTFI